MTTPEQARFQDALRRGGNEPLVCVLGPADGVAPMECDNNPAGTVQPAIGTVQLAIGTVQPVGASLGTVQLPPGHGLMISAWSHGQ